VLPKERFRINRPLEEMECALVRASTADPRLLTPPEEATLRTALSLARLYKIRHDGRDVGVGAALAPFREEVSRRLQPVLLGRKPPRRDQLVPLVTGLKEGARVARVRVLHRVRDRIPEEAVDREIRHKALVLVQGGGGGTGYVYLGAMALLEEFGIRPALMAGSSIGAILALFRSRMERFDSGEMTRVVRGLSWRKLFRVISTENRYGLPAALRLYLRSGIGRYFNAPDPQQPAVRLKDLPIPTLVSVTGIRRGMLPHPVEFYERLVAFGPRSLFNPAQVARQLQAAMGAIAEFVTRPELLVKLHLGADDATGEFDALDAAGFSCALPGVIHYDVLRDDPGMHALLDGIFERRELFRLIDGGIGDNLPAKAAWRAVHKGRIGTRNAFILALNGFAPKLRTPLWLPLERLAELTVAPNRPYAHLVKDFRSTLSPLDLVPSVPLVSRAFELGRRQLVADIPFIARMLAPLPPL
jgi:predicted acylesterase/phospholipase RssA